jgi:hypothetical protein
VIEGSHYKEANMSFRIFFRGLVTHVQVEGSNTLSRAVLVDAKHHVPTLIVKAAAYNTKSGVTPNETLLSNGDRLFDITGWDLSVDGVSDVRTTRLQSFTDHVPSLTAVMIDDDATDKLPHKELHQKTHIKDVTFSYVDYKDGTIETVDCYSDAVEFNPPAANDPECLAEVTMYSVELTGEVTLRLTKGSSSGTIVINQNSSVSISNRAGKGNHFKEYRKLTKAAGIRIPDQKNGRICVDCMPRDEEDHNHDEAPSGRHEKSVRMLAGDSVECTQTGYP